MDIYAILSTPFSKISIISSIALLQNQLDVYFGGVRIGTFVTATHPNPPADVFTKDLVFSSTNTSEGLKWIFEFEPLDINQTNTNFTPGVYHFILNSNGTSAIPAFGVIQDEKLICCMATKSKNADDTGCSSLSNLDIVNQVHALLAGANANLRMGNPTTAVCLYDLASFNCIDCCG